MTLSERLDALRRLAAEATPGPWQLTHLMMEPTEAGKKLAAESRHDYMRSGRWLKEPEVRTAWKHGQSKSTVPIVMVATHGFATPKHTAHMRDADAAYIAAMSPDVALELIASYRALADERDRLDMRNAELWALVHEAVTERWVLMSGYTRAQAWQHEAERVLALPANGGDGDGE